MPRGGRSVRPPTPRHPRRRVRIRPDAGDGPPAPPTAAGSVRVTVGFLDGEGYLFISGRIRRSSTGEEKKIAPSEDRTVLPGPPGGGSGLTVPRCPTRGSGGRDRGACERPPTAWLHRAGAAGVCGRRRGSPRSRFPRRVVFVEQSPRGRPGKIQRIDWPEAGIESLAFAQARRVGWRRGPRARRRSRSSRRRGARCSRSIGWSPRQFSSSSA